MPGPIQSQHLLRKTELDDWICTWSDTVTTITEETELDDPDA